MYLAVESPQQFAEAVAELPREDGACFLILLADTHQRDLGRLVDALNATGVSFLGAVMPGLIDSDRVLKSGAIVQCLRGQSKPVVIALSKDHEPDLGALPAVDQIGASKPGLYIFTDTLSANISGLLAALFDRYGNSVNYFGGGAGNHNLDPGPCLFSAQGVHAQAAIAVMLRESGSVGVRHGWTRISSPLIATRTDGNRIQELNWEPAMDAYRKALPNTRADVPPEEFFSRITTTHPLCMEKEGQEDIVRDPIKVTDRGELICLSNVPNDTVMYIAQSDTEQLRDAAQMAVNDALSGLFQGPRRCLVCNCFSRYLMLADQFPSELRAAQDALGGSAQGTNFEGALVLGEIASDGESSLEYYNKTFVISLSSADD